MCGQPATSREHVPPKCIFPERKDSEGRDFRDQLIRVPSCDLHNLQKSKDDEFLMVSLAGIFGNNSIGYQHKLSKVNRAIRRSSGRLLDAVFQKREHFLITRDNHFIEVIWGTPDYARLTHCFECIAFGLYFQQFRTRFCGKLRVQVGFLHQSEQNPASFSRFIKHRAELDLNAADRLGRNPEVFFYQFSEPDEFGLRLLKMCFYGGLDVFVAFVAEGLKPPEILVMKLIAAGVETHLTVGNEVYKFNVRAPDP